MNDTFWGKVKNAVELVANDGARRIDGTQDGCTFKVYKIPNGPTRIDIQPKEAASDYAGAGNRGD